MDMQRLSRSLRNKVGELHRQRHPAKGVVVEFEGFHDRLARFNRVLHRAREHETIRADAIRQRQRMTTHVRRIGHIRDAVEAGAPVGTITLIRRDGITVGFTLREPDKSSEFIFDGTNYNWLADGLSDFVEVMKGGYVLHHSANIIEDELAALNISLPRFHYGFDTAQVGNLIMGGSPSSTEVGEHFGVDRASYGNLSDFLIAVFHAILGSDPTVSLVNPKL